MSVAFPRRGIKLPSGYIQRQVQQNKPSLEVLRNKTFSIKLGDEKLSKTFFTPRHDQRYNMYQRYNISLANNNKMILKHHFFLEIANIRAQFVRNSCNIQL